MQQLIGVPGEDGAHAVVRVVEDGNIDIDRVMGVVLVLVHLLNLNRVTPMDAVSLTMLHFSNSLRK